MTSQILAIFYLNDLDHYIKEELGIKCYIRYMDDGVLIHYDKNYLKYCLDKINCICIKYKLKLNNKTKIYNVSEGIDFLGYRYFFKNSRLIVRVRNINKRNFKRKIKLYRYDYDKYKNIIGSYNGYFKYANSKNLWYEVIDKIVILVYILVILFMSSLHINVYEGLIAVDGSINIAARITVT